MRHFATQAVFVEEHASDARIDDQANGMALHLYDGGHAEWIIGVVCGRKRGPLHAVEGHFVRRVVDCEFACAEHVQANQGVRFVEKH